MTKYFQLLAQREELDKVIEDAYREEAAKAIADGPFMSFQAIQHPLPEVVQSRLKMMSVAVHDAGEHNGPVLESFDEYLNKVRDVLGVEHLRREFLPNQRPIG